MSARVVSALTALGDRCGKRWSWADVARQVFAAVARCAAGANTPLGLADMPCGGWANPTQRAG